MTPDEILQLKRDIKESVEWAIVASKKVESDGFGDVKQDLKLLQQDIKGIHERLDKLNGRIPKLESKMLETEYKLNLTSSTAKTVIKTAGVFSTIVIGLSVFIFLSLNEKVDHIAAFLEDSGQIIFTKQ